MPNHAHRFVALVLAGLFCAGGAAAFEVTHVDASSWGASDADLGLDDVTVEDFEDLALADGLTWELSDEAGAFSGTGSATLPAVFDPVAGDPYGDAFAVGVWDGAHVLLNVVGNQSVYYGSTDFRAVRFVVDEGTPVLGLALQQVTGDHNLVVNDVVLGRLSSFGIPRTPGRNGYVIVRSTDPAEPIRSLSFGGRGDAFVVDHVAFRPQGPVPATAASWGALKAIFR